MATGQQSAAILCPKCQSQDMERDECASEEMLVCKNCGNILESGSIDTRREFVSGTIGGSTCNNQTTDFSSLKYASHGSSYEDVPRPIVEKKKRIITELDILSDKMRIQQHQKQLCHAKVDAITRLCNFSWKPNEALAASIIFLFATDRSSVSFRALMFHGSFKEKKFKRMIKLVRTTIPLEPPTEPDNEYLDAAEILSNNLLIVAIDIDPTEKEKCLEIANDLLELLDETGMRSRAQSLKSIDACSLLLISLEHIRKKKDQKQEEHVASKLFTSRINISNGVGRIRGILFKLSKEIPSLDDVIESGSLTVHCVIRYIPTIMKNKQYLVSIHKTLSKEIAKNTRKRSHSTSIGEPCVPQEFHWPEDEPLEDTDTDIEEYLATEEEISAKRKAMEGQDCWDT